MSCIRIAEGEFVRLKNAALRGFAVLLSSLLAIALQPPTQASKLFLGQRRIELAFPRIARLGRHHPDWNA
jgi:hypothetical protein